jgi:hypothetical protein
MTVVVPYTFVGGTRAIASQVNADFAAVVDAINTGTRIILSVPTTFWVSSSGSDANPGTVITAPAATIQHVINQLGAAYDVAGQVVTIQILDGSALSENVILRGALVGQTQIAGLVIQGNSSTPSAVSLSGSPAVLVNNNAMCTVRGLTLASPSSYCLFAGNGGNLAYNSVVFGAAAAGHISAVRSATIASSGDYTIAGSAPYHATVSFAEIRLEGPHAVYDPAPPGQPTITLTGTPNFSASFAHAALGGSGVGRGVFVGSATGIRFFSEKNGVVDSGGGGANYFPGSIAGSTATGGQYV